MARRRKTIRHSQAQRQLGTDHCQIDVFSLGEGDEVIGLAQIGWTDMDEVSNAWISRSAYHAGHAGFGGQPADEGVLARAAAEDENLHYLNDLWRVPALHTSEGRQGTISLTLTVFAPRIRRYV